MSDRQNFLSVAPRQILLELNMSQIDVHGVKSPQSHPYLDSKEEIPVNFFPSAATLLDRLQRGCFTEHQNLNEASVVIHPQNIHVFWPYLTFIYHF